MRRRALALAFAPFALALAMPVAQRTASAQTTTPTDATRAEARERFERGLRLFNAGDNSGALVEFRRAYELIENQIVLYNIGLTYAQMARPVESVDALDRLLANPGPLSPERLAIARRTRDEQAARIAEVSVDANVEGARVEIDGVEIAKTPVNGPLRITSGTHVLGLVAPGFSPQRREIAVASGEKQAVRFELVPMQGRLAHLVVKTHLPGADLFVDDQRIASTPLASSISLSPGSHRIQLRRAGYVSASTEIALADGAEGEVTLEPDEDSAALAASGGAIALDVTETLAVVTLDGRPRGVYTAPLRVPAGTHHLVVERGDFAPFERTLVVHPARTTTVRVELEPTPEYRARFVSRAQSQRTWGIVSAVGGAVLAAAGVGLAVYDAKQRSDGNAAQDSILALSVPGDMMLCDPRGQTTTPAYIMGCSDPFNAAASKIADANTRDYFAFSAIGVGAAAVVLGVTLLVVGDDPHKYDPKAAPQGSATWRAVPTFWASRGGGGLGIAGSY